MKIQKTISGLILLTLLLLATPAGITANDTGIMPECEIVIDDFSSGIKPTWKSKSFKGVTEYTWTREDNRGFVKAVSRGTASGLYHPIEFEPHRYPYLTWQWKVDTIPAGGDASRRSGDDYGARIYVIFPSFFFWNTRAINYVWATKLPKGEVLPNPFTSNSMMISVESGPAETGKWLSETRNIYEDYKRVFGKEPPLVGAIAIMTDTDNTGESAAAGYGPIAVCSRDPGQ